MKEQQKSSWGGWFGNDDFNVSINSGSQQQMNLIYIGAGLLALLIIFKGKK